MLSSEHLNECPEAATFNRSWQSNPSPTCGIQLEDHDIVFSIFHSHSASCMRKCVTPLFLIQIIVIYQIHADGIPQRTHWTEVRPSKRRLPTTTSLPRRRLPKRRPVPPRRETISGGRETSCGNAIWPIPFEPLTANPGHVVIHTR